MVKNCSVLRFVGCIMQSPLLYQIKLILVLIGVILTKLKDEFKVSGRSDSSGSMKDFSWSSAGSFWNSVAKVTSGLAADMFAAEFASSSLMVESFAVGISSLTSRDFCSMASWGGDEEAMLLFDVVGRRWRGGSGLLYENNKSCNCSSRKCHVGNLITSPHLHYFHLTSPVLAHSRISPFIIGSRWYLGEFWIIYMRLDNLRKI